MQKYQTVEKKASDEFVEKRSRFIGYVCPVETVDQANDFINEIKQKHWDATHNVSAYILKDGNFKKYSDDGEPQGTAGVPVLDVLEKEKLLNVAVVVTRYFGGTLLGAGGLVRAYSHGAKIAVDSGNIITMDLCSVLEVEVDYNFYGKLSTYLTDIKVVIENTDFSELVKIRFYLSSEDEEKIINKIFDMSNGKYMPKKIGEKYDKTK